MKAAGRISRQVPPRPVWPHSFVRLFPHPPRQSKGMNYVEKLLDGVHSVLNINAATLSGCIDVIAVEQPDGPSSFPLALPRLLLLSPFSLLIFYYKL